MKKNEEMEKLKINMNYYKNKLTDKYNRLNSRSKRIMLSRDLVQFSYLYKSLFGEQEKMPWDNDFRIYDSYDCNDMKHFDRFFDNVNKNNDFYYKLSNNIINTYNNVDYPFYKYFNGGIIINPRLDENTMLNLILSFLKSCDYEFYYDLIEKMENNELIKLKIDENISGMVYPFSSINLILILLNNLSSDNLFKYATIAHEYGHSFEMNLFLKNNNYILIEKELDTPFHEVTSCFFEYAFLNYLKENKIYTNYVDQCLDNYFKEILEHFFQINLIAKFTHLEIDEDNYVSFNDIDIIKYGDKIKNKLNYYAFYDYDEPVDFMSVYMYGVGKLLSVYLYENYKENPNFLTEFKKSLLSYPLVGDLSAFNNVGIYENELIKGETFKKVLKKHCSDFM